MGILCILLLFAVHNFAQQTLKPRVKRMESVFCAIAFQCTKCNKKTRRKQFERTKI